MAIGIVELNGMVGRTQDYTQLQHHENENKSSRPMSYVCGLEQGIRFERIN